MSSSESDAGTAERRALHGLQRGCSAISIAIRTPAIMLWRSSSVVRKLQSTRGFESGSGARSITRPRLVGLITTGPKQ